MSAPRLDSTVYLLDLCERLAESRRISELFDMTGHESYIRDIVETPQLTVLHEDMFELLLGAAGFDLHDPEGLAGAVAVACGLEGTERIELVFRQDDPSPLHVRFQRLEHDEAFADGSALIARDHFEIDQAKADTVERLGESGQLPGWA